MTEGPSKPKKAKVKSSKHIFRLQKRTPRLFNNRQVATTSKSSKSLTKKQKLISPRFLKSPTMIKMSTTRCATESKNQLSKTSQNFYQSFYSMEKTRFKEVKTNPKLNREILETSPLFDDRVVTEGFDKTTEKNFMRKTVMANIRMEDTNSRFKKRRNSAWGTVTLAKDGQRREKAEVIGRMMKSRGMVTGFSDEFELRGDEYLTAVPFYQMKSEGDDLGESPEHDLNKKYKNISFLWEKRKIGKPKPNKLQELAELEEFVEDKPHSLEEIRSIMKTNNFSMFSDKIFDILRLMNIPHEERGKLDEKTLKKPEQHTTELNNKMCRYIEAKRLHGECPERHDSLAVIKWLSKMRRKYNKSYKQFINSEDYFRSLKDILSYGFRETIISENNRCKERSFLVEKLYSESLILFDSLSDHISSFLEKLDFLHFAKKKQMRDEYNLRIDKLEMDLKHCKQTIKFLSEENHSYKEKNRILRKKLANGYIVMKNLREDVFYHEDCQEILGNENRQLTELIEKLVDTIPKKKRKKTQLERDFVDKFQKLREVQKKNFSQIKEMGEIREEEKERLQEGKLTKTEKDHLKNQFGDAFEGDDIDPMRNKMCDTEELHEMIHTDFEIQTEIKPETAEKKAQARFEACDKCLGLKKNLSKLKLRNKILTERFDKMSEELNRKKIRLVNLEGDLIDNSTYGGDFRLMTSSNLQTDRTSNISENSDYEPIISSDGGLHLLNKLKQQESQNQSSKPQHLLTQSLTPHKLKPNVPLLTISQFNDSNSQRLDTSILAENLEPQNKPKLSTVNMNNRVMFEPESYFWDPIRPEKSILKDLEAMPEGSNLNKNVVERIYEIHKTLNNRLQVYQKMVASDPTYQKRYERLGKRINRYSRLVRKFSHVVPKGRLSTSMKPKSRHSRRFSRMPRKSMLMRTSFMSRSLSRLGNKGKDYKMSSLAMTLFNEVLEDIRKNKLPKKRDLIRSQTLLKQVSKIYIDYEHDRDNKNSYRSIDFKMYLFKYFALKNSHKKLLIKNYKQVSFFVKRVVFVVHQQFIGHPSFQPLCQIHQHERKPQHQLHEHLLGHDRIFPKKIVKKL
jgi:hypothetical protein